MQGKWQRLRLQKHEGLPPLLFKFTLTSKGYEVYITDLTQLWSEQLSYRQVLKRAEEDDATIDPSEDAEQYKVLLQKVDEALHSSPGSSMALTSGSRADSLELNVSTKLPAPLKPLTWKLYLSREPHTASTSHLLLPLLREETDRESHQQGLLEQLKQKDWVLAKLFDKIEAMGIDLSTVFPGISGLRGTRKETSLVQAAKYIKGVAPFDEKTWLDNINKASPESGLASNLLTEISGSDASTKLERINPPPDKWWESLDVRGTAAVTPEQEERKEKPVPKEKPASVPEAPRDTGQMDIDTASEDEYDEFERQETPPRFKQQKQPEKEPSVPDEQEPEQPPTRKSPSPSPQKAQPKPSKGLGKIGGGKAKQPSKKPSPQPSPSPPPQPQPPSTASSPDLESPAPEPEPTKPAKEPSATPSDQESDSGSDKKEGHRPPPSPLPPSPPKPKEPEKKKPRGGALGVIGGKKKEQKREPTPTPPAPSPSPEEPPAESPKQDKPASQPEPKPKRAGKLGVIGGKAKAKAGKEEKTPDSTLTETAKPKPAVKKPAPSRSPSPPGIGIRPKKEEEEEDEEKSPSKAKEAEPEREETEQEKADRRREDLKRQLEAKSKAPAKKKRKF